MTEAELLARLLFSETKSTEDAAAIAHTVTNRMKNIKRYGAEDLTGGMSPLERVITKPMQYQGYGGAQFNRPSGKMNKSEEDIFKQFLAISHGVLNGTIPDATSGATHYHTNKMKKKPSWASKIKKTYETKESTYYRE